MRKPLIALSAALLLLMPMPCPALAEQEPASDFRYNGYVKALVSATDAGPDNNYVAETEVRARLKLNGDLAASAKWELAYELSPHYRELSPSEYFEAPSKPPYRIADLDPVIYPSHLDPTADALYLTQNLDRAVVALDLGGADIIIGRQPVAFGSAHAVNPTDVLAPMPYTAMTKDERSGMDALRIKVPTGELGELEAGLVFGKEGRAAESAAYLRVKENLLKADVSLIAMRYKGNSMLGMDLVHSLGGANAWVEAAYTWARSEDEYLRLSAGADYKFTDSLYGYIEYHYNGAGASEREDYLLLLLTPPYEDGAVGLMGRRYLAPGVVYELTPLISVSGQCLINLGDGSVMGAPRAEYNVADDHYITIGGFAGLGPRLAEFGAGRAVYYAILSRYF